MKICPRCGIATPDDSQAFCLMDGTPLVDQLASEPTVVMSGSDPTVTVQQPKKTRTGLWVALALLGIVVVGGLVGLLMYAAYRMGSTSVRVNTNSNSSPTPKPSSTPKVTPQTTSTSTPAQQTTPDSAPADVPSLDEPTPISWTENAAFVKTDAGLTYKFECPPGGSPGTVWGSDIYTADSSVCTAAVHAGKITLDKGGTVTIEFTAGRQTYGATTRNGITTYNYGQYPHSFIFK